MLGLLPVFGAELDGSTEDCGLLEVGNPKGEELAGELETGPLLGIGLVTLPVPGSTGVACWGVTKSPTVGQ